MAEYLGRIFPRYSKDDVTVGIDNGKIFLNINMGGDSEGVDMTNQNAEELIALLQEAMRKNGAEPKKQYAVAYKDKNGKDFMHYYPFVTDIMTTEKECKEQAAVLDEYQKVTPFCFLEDELSEEDLQYITWEFVESHKIDFANK